MSDVTLVAYVNQYISTSGRSTQSHRSTAEATKTWDQTNDKGATWTQDITTSDSAIAIPAGVGTPQLLMVENPDSTQEIDVATATGGSFAAATFGHVAYGVPLIIKPKSGVTY